MNSRTLTRRLAAASAVTLVAGMLTATPAHAAEVEVIASGLNNPRQLAFAPGGTLYVAEAGVRGDSTNCFGPPGARGRSAWSSPAHSLGLAGAGMSSGS